MKPSQALTLHGPEIVAVVERHRARNPCVFGSAARGHDREGSDLDILIDPLPDMPLFDLGAIQEELTDLLGVKVDVVTSPVPERHLLDGLRPVA